MRPPYHSLRRSSRGAESVIPGEESRLQLDAVERKSTIVRRQHLVRDRQTDALGAPAARTVWQESAELESRAVWQRWLVSAVIAI